MSHHPAQALIADTPIAGVLVAVAVRGEGGRRVVEVHEAGLAAESVSSQGLYEGVQPVRFVYGIARREQMRGVETDAHGYPPIQRRRDVVDHDGHLVQTSTDHGAGADSRLE